MPTAAVFGLQLILGYVPWLLFLGAYAWPWMRSMDPARAQRMIATLHSFRFFGLVFIVPGVVGRDLPAAFATSAAYGDFATGLLAMLALAAFRVRPLFWALVVAFNLVGTADLLANYYNGVRLGLPERAGELAATYWIPVLYVPALMITHGLAFYLLVRARPRAQVLTGAAAS
ncbi:MAG: hypothetical protein ACJ798_01220 [Phenylobacterium sp.]